MCVTLNCLYRQAKKLKLLHYREMCFSTILMQPGRSTTQKLSQNRCCTNTPPYRCNTGLIIRETGDKHLPGVEYQQ